MAHEFVDTHIVDPSDPFWACTVTGCQLSFPHAVGITKDREWGHVWADFYAPVQIPNS